MMYGEPWRRRLVAVAFPLVVLTSAATARAQTPPQAAAPLLSHVPAVSISPIPPTVSASPSPAAASWTTYGFDMQRTGYNPQEVTLSPQNVPGLVLGWSANVGSPVLAQPLLYDGMLFVATYAGGVFALNAITGAVVWQVQLPGVAVEANCGAPAALLATPTIDASSNRIFIAAGDGTLHALDLATGNELPGWPMQVNDPANANLHTFVYGSPTFYQSPLGATSHLYVTTAESCQGPPWHGQVVQVSPSTLQIEARWFTVGNGAEIGGGIWGQGGVSLEPGGSAIYAATGSANGTPDNFPYADSIVELSDQLALVAFDAPLLGPGSELDFGATPVLYQPPGCPPQLVAMNKTGALFVYNRTAIGKGATQRIQVANPPFTSDGDFIGLPVYDPLLHQIYVASTNDSRSGPYLHGLVAFKVQADCSLALAWQQQVGFVTLADEDNPAIPPTAANSVVYYAAGQASEVFAFNAATGQGLWTSGTLIQSGTYSAPMVAGGQLFVASLDGNIYAFKPGQ